MSNAVIFADFDGVFHSMDSCGYGDDLVVSHNPDLFRWAPLLWQIIEPHPVDIVVHSSWRHLYPAAALIALFPSAMQPRIVGVAQGRERDQSIRNYVCMHDVKRFAVLDDSPEAFSGNWPNLIVCDSQRGINDADVLAKIRSFVGDATIPLYRFRNAEYSNA